MSHLYMLSNLSNLFWVVYAVCLQDPGGMRERCAMSRQVGSLPFSLTFINP